MDYHIDPLAARNYKGGKVQELNVYMLRSRGFIVKFNDPITGHVSVTPPSLSMLKQWAETRNNISSGVLGDPNSHILTTMAESARITERRVPQTPPTPEPPKKP